MTTVHTKPALLIGWSGTYLFNEAIAPMVPDLGARFSVYVLLEADRVPEELRVQLDAWERAGSIIGYAVVPSQSRTRAFYRSMKELLPRLRQQHFSCFLAASLMSVFERTIQALVLPSSCVRACFAPGVTYLMIAEPIARQLLGRPALVPPPPRRGTLVRGYIVARFQFPKVVRRFVRHYCTPLFYVQRMFPVGKYDLLTQIGTHNVDVALFCDPVEAQAHTSLYPRARVEAVAHPSIGSCRCQTVTHTRDTILSPLSGFVGADRIPLRALNLYCRDLARVVAESGAAGVHLRLHPRERGHWPYELRDALRAQHIVAEVVSGDRPIRAVMCDYLGMAGFASCALRDGRAACDEAFVVGFVGISQTRYADPPFVYGAHEGIAWIAADGTVVPGTFARRQYIAPHRVTVPEVLASCIAAHV